MMASSKLLTFWPVNLHLKSAQYSSKLYVVGKVSNIILGGADGIPYISSKYGLCARFPAARWILINISACETKIPKSVFFFSLSLFSFSRTLHSNLRGPTAGYGVIPIWVDAQIPPRTRLLLSREKGKENRIQTELSIKPRF